jgi:tetratricopeptide (TPR) repeat protein
MSGAHPRPVERGATRSGQTVVALTDPVSIGRYQVVRRLGSGGMGSLYLARDPELDRLVAIKLVKDNLADEDEELRARFAREARSVARLHHPNIVTVFDVGELEGRPFIAMEYIPGESLAEMIRRRAPLSLLQKLTLLEELCSGLAHAHKAGIVHRDVKPANLMVDQDGTLKIVDFGIARLAESTMTKSGMLIGTLNYMSPEQLSGEPVDARTDIFAVGAVFYEMIALRPAFPGTMVEGVLHRICHEPPDPLASLDPDVDPEVERIVLRALEKDPRQRYQDLVAMRRDVEKIRMRLMRAEQVDSASGVWRPITGAASSPGKRAVPERLLRLRQEQIDSHLQAAQREFQDGRYQAAIECAERAVTIDPQEGRALDLIERARAAIDGEEARKLLTDAARHLQQDDLTGAASLADRAAGLIRAESPDDLQRDLRRIQRGVERERERSQAARAALDRARERFASGAYESAIRAADEAIAVDPALEEAHQLIRRAEVALEEQRRRGQSVERAIRRARERLAAGDREGAVEILTGFTPPHEQVSAALREIRDEIAALERQRAEAERQRAEAERQRAEAERARAEAERREREQRIAALTEAARAAITQGRFDAAFASLDEAAPLDPASPALSGLRKQAESAVAAARAAERRRQEEVERQQVEAEARRRAAQDEKARAAREAEEKHREEAARTAEAERERQEAERQRQAAEEARRRAEKEEKARGAAIEAEARKKAADAKRRAEEERARASREADERRREEAVRAAEAKRQQQARRETERKAARGQAPARPGKTLVMSIGVAAGILVLAFIGAGSWWWLSGRSKPPAPVTVVSPPAQPEPGPTSVQPSGDVPATPTPASGAATGAGMLIVDAMPWARVTVTDRDGKPQTLPSTFTPLSVALPAGDYTVTWQPDGGPAVSEKVTIAPDSSRTLFRELRAIDPGDYFRRLGFGARQ